MMNKSVRRLMTWLGPLVLLASALFVALRWRAMPERIPTHYDASGQIDAWGARSTVLLFPVIGLVVYGLMQFISFVISNMKDMGVVRPMLAMETMCRALALLIALTFAYMTVCTALSAPLGRWFLWTSVGLMGVVMAACIVWACIPSRK